MADAEGSRRPCLHDRTEDGVGAITNGDLIRLAESEFDVFVTSDRNIRYQQNLAGRRIAILELSTNDLRRILAASGEITAALDGIQSGDYMRVEVP